MTPAVQAPEPTAVLTVEEVAAWLRVSPRTVLRWQVPALALSPKVKRYLATDVLAWLAQHRALPPSLEDSTLVLTTPRSAAHG